MKDIKFLRFEPSQNWSSSGIIAISREAALNRHPWVSCPNCGAWGLPIPTLIRLGDIPSSAGGILSINEYKKYFNNRSMPLPGSVDVGAIKTRADVIRRGREVVFQWISGCLPFVIKDNRRVVENIFGTESVLYIEAMNGGIVFVVPKIRLFTPGAGLMWCEECTGKMGVIIDINKSAEICFINDTANIAISESIAMALRDVFGEIKSGIRFPMDAL